MSLEMRGACEKCGKALPHDSAEAYICSFECTWCGSLHRSHAAMPAPIAAASCCGGPAAPKGTDP